MEEILGLTEIIFIILISLYNINLMVLLGKQWFGVECILTDHIFGMTEMIFIVHIISININSMVPLGKK